MYVPESERHLAQIGDMALSLDYDLYLGDVLRAHLGIGPGVFFRTDQTLFTLKLKAGAMVLFSRTFGATIGLDYYPIVGDIYFGKTLNLRAGLELFL